MRRELELCFLALVLLCAIAGLVPKAANQNRQAAVLSMREFELKPGIKPEAFENFVRDELAAAVAQGKIGMKMHVMKGDRGERKGRYVLVWEFDSVAALLG